MKAVDYLKLISGEQRTMSSAQFVHKYSFVTQLATVGVAFCLLLGNIAENTFAVAELSESELTWIPASQSTNIDILDMLAKQMQGNYEKISTWTGTYSVQQEMLVSKTFAAKLPQSKDVQPAPMTQCVSFQMQFFINMTSGEIFRAKEHSKLEWRKMGTDEIIAIPNTVVADERSVVTAEHYLHFNAKNLQRGLNVLPDNPDAQMKRVGYRDSLQEAERRDLGDLMDPRMFYNSGSKRKFWDWLNSIAQTASKHGDSLKIYEAAGKGGTWYRFSLKLQTADGRPAIYSIATFSPNAGFNPVSFILSNDESGQTPIEFTKWEWKQADGIFVPAAVEQSNFQSSSKVPAYHRKATLKECTFNKPLDPQQFTYQSLGLKDGDLVMDNIDKIVLSVKNAMPAKLANFNDKYFPPVANSAELATKWRLAIVSGLLILLIAILIVRRYRMTPAS